MFGKTGDLAVQSCNLLQTHCHDFEILVKCRAAKGYLYLYFGTENDLIFTFFYNLGFFHDSDEIQDIMDNILTLTMLT